MTAGHASEASGVTTHTVLHGDARRMIDIPDESVHLVCTSPPYAFLKEYTPGVNGQLGDILDYDAFLDELDQVWSECHRILVPGGRIACVVGDVCLSRRRAGRHFVLPLSADIQVRARRVGLDNLTPIRWYKVANIRLEASRSSVFLGKPNQPNGVVKNDLEHILLLRKPGGYRKPTDAAKERSRISTDDYMKWFSPIWDDVTGQARRGHPAPYPVEIPRRLIKMFSFVGDTVVDPMAGTGTTAVAAIETGRNSISYEIDPSYIEMMRDRLQRLNVVGQVAFGESVAAFDESVEPEIESVREAILALAHAVDDEMELQRAVRKVLRDMSIGLDTTRRLTAG